MAEITLTFRDRVPKWLSNIANGVDMGELGMWRIRAIRLRGGMVDVTLGPSKHNTRPENLVGGVIQMRRQDGDPNVQGPQAYRPAKAQGQPGG